MQPSLNGALFLFWLGKKKGKIKKSGSGGWNSCPKNKKTQSIS
jgi:hypothetical protein